jgi:hypothetical protein
MNTPLRRLAVGTLIIGVAAGAGATGALLGDDTEAPALQRERATLASTRAKLDGERDNLFSTRIERDSLRSGVNELEAAERERTEAETGGYHDTTRLERSIKGSMNSNLRKDGLSVRMDKVGCVAENARNTRFVCLVDYSYGDRQTRKVTVAADGSTWILSGSDVRGDY